MIKLRDAKDYRCRAPRYVKYVSYIYGSRWDKKSDLDGYWIGDFESLKEAVNARSDEYGEEEISDFIDRYGGQLIICKVYGS